MISSRGFNSAVRSTFGVYQLETSVVPLTGQVVSKILRDGQVVDFESASYDPEVSERALMELVRQLHEQKLDELRLLAQLGDAALKSSKVELSVQIGNLLARRGFLTEAETCLTRARRLDISHPPTYLSLARVCEQRGEWGEGLKFLKIGVQFDPKNPWFYYEEGVCLHRLGRDEEAKAAFLRALSLDPGHIQARLYLAYLWSESSPESAQEELEILKLHPFYGGVAKRGLELLEAGKLKAAREQLKDFIELMAPDDPGWVSSEFDLLLRYVEPKRRQVFLEEYLDSIRSRAQLNPDPALHNELGKIYLLMIKSYWDRAIIEFSRAIELNQNYEPARRNRELAEYELRGFLLFLKGLSS